MYQDKYRSSRDHISALLRNMTYKERFYTILNGMTHKRKVYRRFKQTHDHALKWIGKLNVVPFEYGSTRNTNKRSAISVITALFEKLEFQNSVIDLEKIYDQSFGMSPTYRSANDQEYKKSWDLQMHNDFETLFYNK